MVNNTFLKNSINLLKALGADPNENGLLERLKRFFYIFVYFILHVDFILILLYNWKGVDTIAGITIYITFSQTGYKLTSMMFKERHYILALKKISKFTKWENLNGIIKRDNTDTVKIILILTNCYISLATAVLIGYSLTPFCRITSERFTPFDTYFSKYFDNTVFYSFFYVLQEIQLFVTLINLLRYDTLFVSMIIDIVIEIRILKRRIKKLSDDNINNVNEIYKLVNRHNDILGVIKMCNGIFSDVLLMQFLTNILVLSTGLFAIADSGFPPSSHVVIKFGSYFSAAMAQLLLYCTLGQNLINETQSIADAIYDIKWWIKPQPKLRKTCMLIIQRANKLDCLSAAGIFVVDYQSYTQVVKYGFSLFSLLQAIKSQTENY